MFAVLTCLSFKSGWVTQRCRFPGKLTSHKWPTGTVSRLCWPGTVRLTLSDDPRPVVGEFVAVKATDVDVSLIGTNGSVEVGVCNAQRRTAHLCTTIIWNFQCLCHHIAVSHQVFDFITSYVEVYWCLKKRAQYTAGLSTVLRWKQTSKITPQCMRSDWETTADGDFILAQITHMVRGCRSTTMKDLKSGKKWLPVQFAGCVDHVLSAWHWVTTQYWLLLIW